MPTAELGPTGVRIATNLKALRGRVPLRELADRLMTLGRPILASGLVKVEHCDRRVDGDDLVALAIALNVTPNRLLLCEEATSRDLALTPEFSVRESDAWKWACGDQPLPRDPFPEGRGMAAARSAWFVAVNRPQGWIKHLF